MNKYLQIDSSNTIFKEIYMKTQVKYNPNNHVTFKAEIKTPLKNINYINANGDLL